MVHGKTSCEQQKDETENNPKHPHTAHVVLHGHVTWVVGEPRAKTKGTNANLPCEGPRLQTDECIELSVIKLSNTTAHPEAVVVELADALSTVLAVSGSEWKFTDATHLASPILFEFKFFNVLERWLRRQRR